MALLPLVLYESFKVMESQKYLGWKRPLRPSSSTLAGSQLIAVGSSFESLVHLDQGNQAQVVDLSYLYSWICPCTGLISMQWVNPGSKHKPSRSCAESISWRWNTKNCFSRCSYNFKSHHLACLISKYCCFQSKAGDAPKSSVGTTQVSKGHDNASSSRLPHCPGPHELGRSSCSQNHTDDFSHQKHPWSFLWQ